MTTTGLENTTALVTGAQGFIGCWLAERLLEEGAQVVVPARSVEPRSRFRIEGIEERCEVVHADVLDHEALVRTLADHRVELVFHLAAQPIVGVANRSPHSTWENNIRGTYMLLDACRVAAESGSPPPRIVVASSDHAYGDHEQLPYREDFAFTPRFPYDVSKACADMVARSYATVYELPVAVTRMANTFGGGDLNWSRIVPDSARALVAGRRPVIRSDGTPERDYLYVEDAVDAYLAVASSLEDPPRRGRAWNVGLGTPVSVLELVRTLIAVSGRNVEPDVRGPAVPPGEIDRLYPDSTAIREQLGWFPRWDLESGLEASYRWYERYLAGAPAAFVADPA
jgi:CDP-glucose 4,6-dehydratase